MVELHYVMMCGHIREVVECTKQVSCMAQQNLSHQKKLQDASQPLEISLDQHGDIWMTIIHSLFFHNWKESHPYNERHQMPRYNKIEETCILGPTAVRKATLT